MLCLYSELNCSVFGKMEYNKLRKCFSFPSLLVLERKGIYSHMIQFIKIYVLIKNRRVNPEKFLICYSLVSIISFNQYMFLKLMNSKLIFLELNCIFIKSKNSNINFQELKLYIFLKKIHFLILKTWLSHLPRCKICPQNDFLELFVWSISCLTK